MERKILIRKQFLTLRNSLTEEEREKKSAQIISKIVMSKEYQKASEIFCYYNYKSEVITKQLIQQAIVGKKHVYCPKVMGSDMFFFEVTSLDDFEEGYQGIKEPRVSGNKIQEMEEHLKRVPPQDILIIVPGSVFSVTHKRIGYGKGFYDRFLQTCPQCTTIALAYDCQVCNDFEVEEHDQIMDCIYTESNII